MAEANNKIRFEVSAPLALVAVDCESSDNCIDEVALGALEEAFERARETAEIGVVIFSGSGTRFFATADLAAYDGFTPPQAKAYAERGQALARQIEQLGKPVIAVINGLAEGVGLELALAATLRLASDQARFAFPALRAGFIPCFGGTQRLARLIGKGRALELLLTGESITAEMAERLGLVNRVCGERELFYEARAVAQKISNNSPLAIKYCLEALVNGLEMPLEEGLFLEATLFGLCCAAKSQQNDKTTDARP